MRCKSEIIRFLLVLVALQAGVAASAKTGLTRKPLENNVQLGVGVYIESGEASMIHRNPGQVWKLSYGLDIRLSDHWSVMPGVGWRVQGGTLPFVQLATGSSAASMSAADVFCQGRYLINSGKVNVVIGLGPQLSFMTTTDKYYFEDPNIRESRSYSGCDRLNRWDVGIMPSIGFLIGNHLSLGLEGSIGLTNMLVQYPDTEHPVTGNIHLSNVMFFAAWRF